MRSAQLQALEKAQWAVLGSQLLPGTAAKAARREVRARQALARLESQAVRRVSMLAVAAQVLSASQAQARSVEMPAQVAERFSRVSQAQQQQQPLVRQLAPHSP